MSGDVFDREFDVVAETRRRWSRDEKLAIVKEASGPCVNVSAVARRHGIKPALLYRWRKELAHETKPEMSWVPVVVHEPPAPTSPAAVSASSPEIEITLSNGRIVKVPAGLDAAILKRLLSTIDT